MTKNLILTVEYIYGMPTNITIRAGGKRDKTHHYTQIESLHKKNRNSILPDELDFLTPIIPIIA